MTVNLNTVLTGIVTAMTLAVLSNGWDLNRSMVKVQANQDAMTKQLADMVPRAEFEARFKAIEVRQSAIEVELIKLRDRR